MPLRFSKWWVTAAITYADRLLAFAVPFFVLKGLHDETAYTAVEYIISVSVMVSTFGDLGIRNYILYQYRRSGDKATTTRLTLAGYCCTLIFQCFVIAFAALIVWPQSGLASVSTGLLVLAALLRAGALGANAIAYQLAVLHDRPALASLPSLCQWLLVVAALLLWPKSKSSTLELAVAVPSLPFMLVGLVFGVRALREVGTALAVTQVAHAVRWGWPLLASAALSIGIANVSRIYGFTHLAQADLIALNFWLRVLSIIQLTHATVTTTLVLEIYEQHEPGILWGNFRRYAKVIVGAMVLVSGLFAIASGWLQIVPMIGFGAFCALGGYTLTWCIGAYLEAYVTRDGRPGVVLRAAAVSAGAYALLLLATQPATVAPLGTIMILASLLNLILLARAAHGSSLKAVAKGGANSELRLDLSGATPGTTSQGKIWQDDSTT